MGPMLAYNQSTEEANMTEIPTGCSEGAKFRKKSVEVEVITFEYSEDGIRRLKEFCGDHVVQVWKEDAFGSVGVAHIVTVFDGGGVLPIKHTAVEGDKILKSADGEFSPMKPSIFNKTYEPAL